MSLPIQILLLILLVNIITPSSLTKSLQLDLSSRTTTTIETKCHNNNNNNNNNDDVDSSSLMNPTRPSPPPHEEAARMARYITHNSIWGSLATISTSQSILGFPFANVFSLSDGSSVEDSSGVPYMYLTPLDMSVQDLKSDSRCSLTMSLAQGDYCDQNGYDPQDPRCAHVMLTGNMVKVAANTPNEDFARFALFSRHPSMMDWPQDHNWFFAKFHILNILVLDSFGGVKTVSLKDYFEAKPYTKKVDL